MLERLRVADFAPLVDQRFTLALEGLELVFTLTSARALGAAPATDRREPFSLVFRGPPGPALAQRIYQLHHAALGTLEVFLVPIGPDSLGQLYQAIFT